MSIDRLMKVLETLAVAGRPISATELQPMTGIPRPTCYRLLQSFAEHRFLDETEQKSRFVIGAHLVQVALLAKTDAGVAGVVSPVMKEAAAQFGEAVFLARLRSNNVSIIHVETPEHNNGSYFHPGFGKRPLHACSCSKAIAAFAREEFREQVLNGQLKSFTKHTTADRQSLEAELLEVQKLGYAECVEEIERGVSSVAAPIKIGGAGALFSVGAIGAIKRFDAKHRAKRGEKLMVIAEKISSLIQFNGQF
ncbi:IclR family transcriptional regulator [uncultured Roseovarius sp.]|uniref:IclR family transcriptional regulator n=1 Tax=uncultured Roseovarius sp. TaxID=293344 RepID=UPI00262A8C5F|nr:IclR family transcriptional regulator [uncultured Roseovarius sp.]